MSFDMPEVPRNGRGPPSLEFLPGQKEPQGGENSPPSAFERILALRRSQISGCNMSWLIGSMMLSMAMTLAFSFRRFSEKLEGFPLG